MVSHDLSTLIIIIHLISQYLYIYKCIEAHIYNIFIIYIYNVNIIYL